MTVYLPIRHVHCTRTGSLFWYHAVMSLHLTTSASLSAEGGCESWERVVLKLTFIA